MSGPDMEARRNWKKAIRKAILMSKLATAKAIDPGMYIQTQTLLNFRCFNQLFKIFKLLFFPGG